MKLIPLWGKFGKGKFAVVDDQDYDKVKDFRWHVKDEGYVLRKPFIDGKQVRIWLHRTILNAPKDKFVDHKNGDKLDNRRENIRLCTRSENNRNRNIDCTNTSGYKGVSWHKADKLWRVVLHIGNKYKYIGGFKNKEKAAMAYDVAAVKYFGEFAKTNRDIARRV